jgi:hypothetical protein
VQRTADERTCKTTFQNVFATLYHNLGFDPCTALPDRGGRPMTLLDEREPIREIV